MTLLKECADKLGQEFNFSGAEIQAQVSKWDEESKQIPAILEQVERWKQNIAGDKLKKFPRSIALHEAALGPYRELLSSSQKWAQKTQQAQADRAEETPTRSANPFEKRKLLAWNSEGRPGTAPAPVRGREGEASGKLEGLKSAGGSFNRRALALERTGAIGTRRSSSPSISNGNATPSGPACRRQSVVKSSSLGKKQDADIPVGSFYSEKGTPATAAAKASKAPAKTRSLAEVVLAAPRQAMPVTRQAAKPNQDPIEISSDEEVEAVVPRNPTGHAEGFGLRRTTRNNAFKSTGVRFEGLRALYPAGGGVDSLQLLAADLSRLDPDEFLNDTIIDFFLKHVQVQMEAAEAGSTSKLHFFSSFFYKKLTEKSGEATAAGVRHEQNHERVRKWTKGKDLFAKDFLFVPIHDHLHWSLLIICFPADAVVPQGRTSCMLLLDSMEGGHSMQPVSSALRGYLENEWKRKSSEEGTIAWKWRQENPTAGWPKFAHKEMPCRKPSQIPRQDNFCDCGLFMLTYAHYFAYASPPNLNPDKLQELGDEPDGYPLLLTKKWFSSANPGHLRIHLRHLVLKLFVEQAQDETAPPVLEAIRYRDELAPTAFKYEGPEDRLAYNTRERQRQQEMRLKAEADKAKLQVSRAEAASRAADAAEARRKKQSQAGMEGSQDPHVIEDSPVPASKTRRREADMEAEGIGQKEPSQHIYFHDYSLELPLSKHFQLHVRTTKREGLGEKAEDEVYVVSKLGGANVEAGEDLPSREFRTLNTALEYIKREVAGRESADPVCIADDEDELPQKRCRGDSKAGASAPTKAQQVESDSDVDQPPAKRSSPSQLLRKDFKDKWNSLGDTLGFVLSDGAGASDPMDEDIEVVPEDDHSPAQGGGPPSRSAVDPSPAKLGSFSSSGGGGGDPSPISPKRAVRAGTCSAKVTHPRQRDSLGELSSQAITAVAREEPDSSTTHIHAVGLLKGFLIGQQSKRRKSGRNNFSIS